MYYAVGKNVFSGKYFSRSHETLDIPSECVDLLQNSENSHYVIDEKGRREREVDTIETAEKRLEIISIWSESGELSQCGSNGALFITV